MKIKLLILLLFLVFLLSCEKINTPEKISKRKIEARILKCEYERNISDDSYLSKLLLKAKREKNTKLIKRILVSFCRIRKPEYIELILPFLKYKNYKIRAQAMFSLGEILKKENRELFLFKLTPEVLNSIKDVSEDTSILVRANLIEALGKIERDLGIYLKKCFIFKKKYSDDEIYYLHQLFKTAFRLRKTELIPLIEKYLRCKNEKLVVDALFTLRILLREGNLKISLGKELVESFFKSKNKYVLSNFIRLIPYLKFSDSERFNIYKRVLSSSNYNARIETIRVLGREKKDEFKKLLVKHFKSIFDSFSAYPTSSVRGNLNEIKEVLNSLRGYKGEEWKKIVLNLYDLYPYFRSYLTISYLSSFRENRENFVKKCIYFPTEDHYLQWVKFLSSSEDVKLNDLAYKIFWGLTGYNIDVNWILSGKVVIADNLLRKGKLDPIKLLGFKYSPVRELALYKINNLGSDFIYKNKDVIALVFRKYLSSESVGDKLAFIEISRNLGEDGKNILKSLLKNKNYIIRLKSAWALKKFFKEDFYKEVFSYRCNLKEDYFYRVALYEELPLLLNVKTTCGLFQIRLFPRLAPFSVENFISLFSSGFYDRNVFHRVIPDFVVQWGSLRGSGYFDSGYTLPSEFSNALYSPFVLGKANSGMDTSSSQLFITLSPEPHLEGYYTLLGEVVGGRDTLEKVTQNDMILGIKLSYPLYPDSVEVVY